MNIMSPVSSANEVDDLMEAGARELYCGVLSRGWSADYTNIAAPNRREWTVSNLKDLTELKNVIALAHSWKGKVNLVLNALYTRKQYPKLCEFLEEVRPLNPDAVIVADPGLMLLIRQMRWDIPIHASTGCTVFNVRAARFFHQMGAARVIFPRQNTVSEMVDLAGKIDFMEKEAFIFNSGCRNIDGFCTFHHGVNEVLKKDSWKLLKKLGLDFRFLTMLWRLPRSAAIKLTRAVDCMPDSACLLNYKVEFDKGEDDPDAKALKSWLESGFNFFFGLDTCGSCALYKLYHAGIDAVKIVGRENPTDKKLRDVRYIAGMLKYLEEEKPGEEEFKSLCRKEYGRFFGYPCGGWCYYPEVLEGEKL